ncbi:MAG: NAD-dependent epimerase/dehydratase family protein, partial [Deltaproteobacteria bacterium]|nr:NAD-dependent epimerase/dehydratase family protein [Deltaproteobacteria bacterium]
MSPAAPTTGRVVAITGACTYLGGELLRRLEEDPRYEKVLALDIRPPALAPGGKVEFIKIDLTQPTVDAELATLLQRYKVDTFVHGAFLSHPTHAAEWAHELEDVGTMHVLNACAGVAPRRFVMISTTLVYGAHPKNPNFLTEESELRGHRDSRFVNDKVRAEKQVQRFAREHPEVEVCTLRFAPILGPTISNMYTRFFSRPVAPVMMGHDPLMQFVHEQDAAFALARAVESRCTGAFNIVGKGVLPYTTVLALLGRVPVPMPQFVARQLSKVLWATQLVGSPPSFLDFLGVAPEDGATDVARA